MWGIARKLSALFFAEKRLSWSGLSTIKCELSPIHPNYPKLIAISTNQLQLPLFAETSYEYEEYEDKDKPQLEENIFKTLQAYHIY